MTDNGQKITQRQERAIAVLIASPTIREAAESLRVNEVTLYRWLREREFQAAYRQARREVVAQAVARLQEACSTAVNTLIEVMGDGEAPCSSRVTAAKSVLELAFKAVELEDLDARVTALEERTEQ
jgi:transposase